MTLFKRNSVRHFWSFTATLNKHRHRVPVANQEASLSTKELFFVQQTVWDLSLYTVHSAVLSTQGSWNNAPLVCSRQAILSRSQVSQPLVCQCHSGTVRAITQRIQENFQQITTMSAKDLIHSLVLVNLSQTLSYLTRVSLYCDPSVYAGKFWKFHQYGI